MQNLLVVASTLMALFAVGLGKECTTGVNCDNGQVCTATADSDDCFCADRRASTICDGTEARRKSERLQKQAEERAAKKLSLCYLEETTCDRTYTYCATTDDDTDTVKPKSVRNKSDIPKPERSAACPKGDGYRDKIWDQMPNGVFLSCAKRCIKGNYNSYLFCVKVEQDGKEFWRPFLQEYKFDQGDKLQNSVLKGLLSKNLC